MDNVDTHNLLLSKENIQPLRRGRDTSKLCAALQAETDSELQQILEKQRNEFEIRLRSHSSDDPLSDWCDYIHWIEQSFPKQPREGKLNVVLRKCLNKFKDTEKYKNDVRFVKLCIKYAEIEDNTVEFLSQIHRHGIGTTCAELYIGWAEKYAMINCFKKANIIYEKGIENRAEPLSLLKEAHQNFHAFLVRRMLNVQEEFKPTFSEPAAQNVRQPYNVLRPVPMGQTEVISNNRIGPYVKGSPGKVKMGTSQERKSKTNTCIKIFEDAEYEHAAVEPTAKLEKIPNKKKSSKENTIKPGPWTDKQNKKVPFNIEFLNNPFQVHRDEEECFQDYRVQSVLSSALKSHKRKDFEDSLTNIPLFYPESEDKTKIAMYCKDQVYAGGLEFQFEELRAIDYNKKRIEKIMGNSKPNINEELNLKTSKQIEVNDSARMPVFKTSSPMDLKKNFNNEVNKPESKVLNFQEDSNSGEIEKNKMKRKTVSSKTKPVDRILDNKCLTEEIAPTTDYSMNQTIHTKEALSEMQQLWFSKPASPLLQDNVLNKQVGKSILKPTRPCFNLYIDESCLDNFKKVEMPEGPLDLTIKSGSLPEMLLPNRGNADINAEEKIHNFATSSQVENEGKDNALRRGITQFGEENKENNIPPDYCGEYGKSTRKVTGILTPAENVPVAPLNEAEDDGAYEEEDDLIYCGAAQCNTTGITENLTKAFQFPKNESTPNPRKSCQFKQNVNRSLFDFEAPENKTDVCENALYKEPVKLQEEVQSSNSDPSRKRSPSIKEKDHLKNLSVIVETSREYKSSSSGSSGVSTSQSRSFKNYPVTPLDVKGYTCSVTASTCVFNKTKKFSLTGYEASTENTQTGLRNELIASEKTGFTKGDSIEYSRELYSSNIKETVPVEDLMKSGIILSSNNEENIRPQYTDPFSDSVIDELLKLARFPSPDYANGLINVETPLPLPKVGSSITLGYYKYEVKKILGEGSYARVYDLTNKTTGSRIIAKIQKPPCRWEFYIVKELHLRINDKVKAESFMKIESAYFFQNLSVLLTVPVEYGNLLDAINALKQNQQLCQLTAVYFTVDILKILDILHSCKIIHADIKPDNFLIKSRDGKPRLQLIDFGRSIDMTLFAEGTTFNKVITTDGFTTIEMRTGKPWTYQVDFYGAANCSHCLLYGDYMTVTEKNGIWNITKLIPRYWAREEWKNYFTTLLNIESCSDIPKISSLIDPFQAMLTDNKELDLIVHRLDNLLMSR